MSSTQKNLKLEYLEQVDRLDLTLTNLSLDCFEFSAYQELINNVLQLPDDNITPYNVFGRALDNMSVHLQEFREAYVNLKELHQKLLENTER